MSRLEIEEILKLQIAEVTGSAGDLEMDKKLKEDIGLDSLSLVTVIVALEEALGIRFDDADLDPSAILTPQDLILLIEKSYEKE